MASQAPPNYYAILEIPETASQQQIREAYKRGALKTHPDRVPADSPDRPVRTRKFQLVNDAYFTLSDAGRRRDYDAQRRMFGTSSASDPFASADAFADDPPEADPSFATGGQQQQQQGGFSPYSWAWNYFTGRGGNNNNNNNNNDNQSQGEKQQQANNAQFGDVFEEMLKEEGMAEPSGAPTGAFWSMLGGVSGGALGFIMANVPGMVAGAVAGNRLGAVRDVKGKSVYSVYQDLPQADRARLLSQLAAKVFSHAVGI